MAQSQNIVSALYRRYGNEIQTHIAVKLGSRDDVDDLSQEVFLRAHRVLASTEIKQPRAYLYQVASSVVTDHYRRRMRLSAPPPDMESLDEEVAVAAAEPTPEEIAIAVQTLQALEAAIADLPAKARQAVLLRSMEDLSYNEVALRMGISVKTVEKHLARGMANLRASIAL